MNQIAKAKQGHLWQTQFLNESPNSRKPEGLISSATILASQTTPLETTAKNLNSPDELQTLNQALEHAENTSHMKIISNNAGFS